METQFIITVIAGLLLGVLLAIAIIYRSKYNKSMKLIDVLNNQIDIINNQIGDKRKEISKLDSELTEFKTVIKEDLISQIEANNKLISEKKELKKKSKEVIETYFEVVHKSRILKGNVTRYKNRDLKNKALLKAYDQKLADLGVKFSKIIIGSVLGEDEYVFDAYVTEAKADATSPEIITLSTTIVCNCMNPDQGLGGYCKKCRKLIKKNV